MNLLDKCEVRFEPISGRVYWMYEREDGPEKGTLFMSLVPPGTWKAAAPDNWIRQYYYDYKMRHVGSFKYISKGEWEEIIE